MKSNKKERNKSKSNLDFRIMSSMFTVRDFFKNPMNKVNSLNLKFGYMVLDYGCGPGSYSIGAAGIVGPSGKILAADIHPLAIEKVRNRAEKKGLTNIETILTDCDTGLQDNSIHMIICFDVFHDILHQERILKEFHRVLKPDFQLALDDHHLNEKEILSKITANGLFKLKEKKDKIYFFTKV